MFLAGRGGVGGGWEGAGICGCGYNREANADLHRTMARGDEARGWRRDVRASWSRSVFSFVRILFCCLSRSSPLISAPSSSSSSSSFCCRLPVLSLQFPRHNFVSLLLFFPSVCRFFSFSSAVFGAGSILALEEGGEAFFFVCVCVFLVYHCHAYRS
jgi:hypothetical protein